MFPCSLCSLGIIPMPASVYFALAIILTMLPCRVLIVGMTLVDTGQALDVALMKCLSTAIPATSGIAVLGVLRPPKHSRFSLSRDIALPALDDAAWNKVLHPPTSKVRQPISEIATQVLAAVSAQLGRLELSAGDVEAARGA